MNNCDERPLSDLQIQIIFLVSKGMTAREISVILNFSTKHIENQLYYARYEVGARNTPHLVAISKDCNWI